MAGIFSGTTGTVPGSLQPRLGGNGGNGFLRGFSMEAGVACGVAAYGDIVGRNSVPYTGTARHGKRCLFHRLLCVLR